MKNPAGLRERNEREVEKVRPQLNSTVRKKNLDFSLSAGEAGSYFQWEEYHDYSSSSDHGGELEAVVLLWSWVTRVPSPSRGFGTAFRPLAERG